MFLYKMSFFSLIMTYIEYIGIHYKKKQNPFHLSYLTKIVRVSYNVNFAIKLRLKH